MHFISISSCVVLTLVAFASEAVAETKPIPPKPRDLLGAYIASSHGGTEFYRLNLGERGSGSFVIINGGRNIDLYTVSSWDVQGHDLHIALKPEGRAEMLELTTFGADRSSMRIEILGKAVGWKRSLVFYNEKQWEDNLRLARKVVAQARTK